MSERSPLLRSVSTAVLSDPDNHHLHTAEYQVQISTLRGYCITVCLFVLIFLSTCNVSALTTIQSSIATDLHATTETSWFISALLISAASVTPIAGQLSQVFTERIYLLWSVLIQAVGLLISALSPNVVSFLLGRVVYGIGIAALAPVAVILVKDHAPERLQGLFFGLINCGYTTGVACGAIIAGALEPVAGWRAVFWLQCPIVVVLAMATFFAIPKSSLAMASDETNKSVLDKLGRLDYFGMLTLMAAVVSLLYSLSAPVVLIRPILLSMAWLVLFLFVEVKWAVNPIIPESVLRSRGAILTGLSTVGVMSARWGVLFYMPIYGIAVRQWSQERSGSLLISTNAGFGIGGLVAGWLHVRSMRSYYSATLLSFATFAISMLSVALLTSPDANVPLLNIALVVNGFIAGALMVYLLAHVLFITAPEHRTTVIPVNIMFRNLASAIGSSVAGGTFLRSLKANLHQGFANAGLGHKRQLIDQLLARPLLVQKLSGVEKQIAIASYSSSLRVLYLAGVALVVAMLVVQAGTGWEAPKSEGYPKRTVLDDDGAS